MQHRHGAKVLVLNSGCTACSPMLIIHAWDGASLVIGTGMLESGCVYLSKREFMVKAARKES